MFLNRLIGIIGGNGVAATNKLCELIENRITRDGAFRDMHHPEMIIWQATQAPSRSMYVEGRGPSYIDEYVSIAKQLKTLGASVICMCCNTAHYAIDEIQSKSEIPFINLIEEVVKEVAKSGMQNVGLMASDGCVQVKIYEKYFERICPDINVIFPEEAFQKEITRGICNIKNSNRFLDDSHPDRPKNIFTGVYNYLIDKGADVVIAGCTDIRVDFKHENTIDSLEILTDKIYNLTKYDK